MKCLDKSRVRMVFLTCIAAAALTGVYSAGAPYLDSKIGRLSQIYSAGQGDRGNQRSNSDNNAQDSDASSECVLACSLPDGWQANWSGEKLWIVHYNPNGTVADALPFDSLKDFYHWFDTHPDCCDVDVDKCARDRTEAAVCVTTTALDTTAPTSGNSDKSSAQKTVTVPNTRNRRGKSCL